MMPEQYSNINLALNCDKGDSVVQWLTSNNLPLISKSSNPTVASDVSLNVGRCI